MSNPPTPAVWGGKGGGKGKPKPVINYLAYQLISSNFTAPFKGPGGTPGCPSTLAENQCIGEEVQLCRCNFGLQHNQSLNGGGRHVDTCVAAEAVLTLMRQRLFFCPVGDDSCIVQLALGAVRGSGMLNETHSF